MSKCHNTGTKCMEKYISAQFVWTECVGPTLGANVTSARKSKDVPTQMTRLPFTFIYFITFRKTIHFKTYAEMFTVEDNIFPKQMGTVHQTQNKKSVSDFYICKNKLGKTKWL